MKDFNVVRNALGTPVLKATVAYESNGIPSLSYIALFNGDNKHYFLTMISRSRPLEDKKIFNKIVDSIRTQVSETEEARPSFPWFFLILGLAVLGYVYFKHFHKANSPDE